MAAVPWMLLGVFVVGIALGYFVPGRTDKSAVLFRGFLAGLALAIIVSVLAYWLDVDVLGLSEAGFFGILLGVLVITVVFVIGTWIGDLIGGARRGPPAPAHRRT